jgi:Glycosyl transferase family group 2
MPEPSPRRRGGRYNEAADATRRLFARFFAFLTLATGLYYIFWAFNAVNPAHPIMGALFLGAEICCLGLFMIASVGVWRLRFKPPSGLPPDRVTSVDIFVPVCGEPIPVVRETFNAVVGIQWAGQKTVYILDDGHSDDVRALAKERGFIYRSRHLEGVPQVDAKAGNLNFGLAGSSGEFILVLDADQVAVPQILNVLAGYMRFPLVAFIQSQQSFAVSEDDPFFNNDRVFYEAMQLGLDGGDSVISCGSGVLYRRAALDEVGGFVTWNLVEDLTTSYELHQRGWKTLYYPYPLSRGLAPNHIWEVYQQRGQWAFDTLRLFFWDSPLFKPGLRWFSRISYLIVGLSYLCAAFVFPFFFIVPVWSYLTGGNVLRQHELEFALIRGIYFACMAVAMELLFRGRQPGKQFQLLTGLFPVYARAAVLAMLYPRGRKPAYQPNNRARSRRDRPRIVAVLPQLLILGANAILPFYAAQRGVVPGRLIAANIFISALTIWSLLPIVLATFAETEATAVPSIIPREPAHGATR